MNLGEVQFETDDRGVATLMLNRPEKHNAISGSMITVLTGVAESIAANPSIRVVLLSARGKSFCAGADLNWMREQLAANRETRIRESVRFATMLNRLDSLDRPVIGKIQGQAFGGGIGLMCICDVTIGVPGCRFGLTETRLGLIPATISPYVIARVGNGKSRQIFVSPRLFSSKEACDLGLLSRVVTPERLNEEVAEEIDACLSAAPMATAAAKRLAKSQATAIDDTVIIRTARLLADTLEGDEARQGTNAFFTGRPPAW